MKKIILGAVLLISVLSCTKEETVNDTQVKSNIERISDGSVKEGYIGTIGEAKKLVYRGDPIGMDFVPVQNTNKSMVFLVYADENVFLTFSDWGSPETGAPFYTQGDYIVYKVEKGKVYFYYEHKIGEKWVKCEHVLNLSNGIKHVYLGGNFGSEIRNGNHPTGVFDPNDYFIDFY